ncbi:MAG: outer membrane beta-barrel protein, partial [Deltaproteobacteria bacterium]|nr:outer membrane beta-barrel protein [Deltaproteobacteria bacterium]
MTPAAALNGVSFSGLLDVYYAYNFNRPAPTTPPASTSVGTAGLPPGNTNLRYYDQYHNQIALSLAELEVKRSGTEVSFLIDLDFGHAADINAAANLGTSTQVIDEVSKH